MRALVYTADRTVQMRSVPDPNPRPDQAVLRVEATGICGSDITGFVGHSARRKPPLVLGHEVIGAVHSLPAGGWPVRVGDRVVANPLQSCGRCRNCLAGRQNVCSEWRLLGMDREEGAFAEFVAVAARNLYPVAPDIPLGQALMIEPLANGVHLFRKIVGGRFGAVAIFGAGTQGMLLLQLARLLGHTRIAIIDTNDARLSAASAYGASILLNPSERDIVGAVAEWTDGEGVDVSIDAVGAAPVRDAAVRCTRKGGQVMLLGLHEATTSVDFSLVVRNELALSGCFAFTPDDFAASKALLEAGSVSIAKHVKLMPLADGQAAFDLLTGDPGSTMKVGLIP